MTYEEFVDIDDKTGATSPERWAELLGVPFDHKNHDRPESVYRFDQLLLPSGHSLEFDLLIADRDRREDEGNVPLKCVTKIATSKGGFCVLLFMEDGSVLGVNGTDCKFYRHRRLLKKLYDLKAN